MLESWASGETGVIGAQKDELEIVSMLLRVRRNSRSGS